MGFVVSVVEALVGAIISWLAFVVIYRLKFHPLAKFPGPLLAKLSDLHAVYYSIRGESHLKIWRAHEQYGPVVRIGPNKLVFNSAQALHGELGHFEPLADTLLNETDIYEAKEVKKSVGYTALVTTPGHENTFNCVDKTRARRKRKIIGQGFSEQAMRSFEPAITKQLDILLKQIHCTRRNKHDEAWTLPINLSPRFKWFMMDITGEFGFGKSFDLQTTDTNRKLVKAVIDASKAGGVVGQYPRLKSLRLPKWSSKTNKKPSFFGALTKRYFDERIVCKSRQHPDLYSFVMDKKEEDAGKFTLDELLGESRLLILAGSDTTAAALAATFFYLSRNPHCYQKLVAHIRSSFDSASEIKSGPKLAALTYLRACIDESMRMSPPVGGALGREVLGDGHVIDGTFVQGGCDVGVALYCLHHDEDIFPDSFKYEPDRWLEGHVPAQRLARQRRAFNPFSAGSRKCVAQTMAYTTLSVAVAKILWFFDVRRPEGDLDSVGGGSEGNKNGRHRVDEFQLSEHFTSIHDGPCLEFRCRPGMEEALEAL